MHIWSCFLFAFNMAVNRIDSFSVSNVAALIGMILCVILFVPLILKRRKRLLKLPPMAKDSVFNCITEMSGTKSNEYVLNLARTMKKVIQLFIFHLVSCIR